MSVDQDHVCGPPNIATILCSWEFNPDGNTFFFNLTLPNGTSVDVPNSQTSYSFNHTCQDGGGQNVLISNNCNSGTEVYNLQDLVGKYVTNATKLALYSVGNTRQVIKMHFIVLHCFNVQVTAVTDARQTNQTLRQVILTAAHILKMSSIFTGVHAHCEKVT